MISTRGPNRRVVVTGLGVISPLGNRPDAFWSSIMEGTSGVRRLRSLPTDGLPVVFGGESIDFTGDAADFGVTDKQAARAIKKSLKVMCREVMMGVAAAQLALIDADLSAERRDPDRTGVVYASDYIQTSPFDLVDAIRACLGADGVLQLKQWSANGIGKIDPLWLLKYLPNMPASHIAILNDLRGPSNSLTVREAGANLAVAEAYWSIARGNTDAMIAGATGSRIHPLCSTRAALREPLARGDDPAVLCRPFDRGRSGMVLGEGAGALVLEERERAIRRGAVIWGEITGYGSSAVLGLDHPDHGRRAMRNALAGALASSEHAASDIGHVHAHGLGTIESDIAEARAIADLFGPNTVPVIACKSYFGNLGAAGGMVELIASLLAMRNGRSIPVRNYRDPDPECPVAVVIDADTAPGDRFINLSVSPQGQASAILIDRASA
ncbi:MAG: beta-ketoacyl-[acyl-carrier-protein] synthase family protein [Planctomycetes bacterium]|nr:beta-ketoacyl-[acyl-carrier-protein] synthase family protein [Planctomycetota bacterium]